MKKDELIKRIIKRKLIAMSKGWCENTCSDGCFYPHPNCHYKQ